MAHVLAVTTGQLGNPIAILVLMEPDDPAPHPAPSLHPEVYRILRRSRSYPL